MSKMHFAVIGSAVLIAGLLLGARGVSKERWDILGWAAFLVTLGYAVLDYASGSHKIQAVIGWFSDPSWRVAFTVVAALALILLLSRLALAGVCKVTYEISRAWHRGAHDAGRARDETKAQSRPEAS